MVSLVLKFLVRFGAVLERRSLLFLGFIFHCHIITHSLSAKRAFEFHLEGLPSGCIEF